MNLGNRDGGRAFLHGVYREPYTHCRSTAQDLRHAALTRRSRAGCAAAHSADLAHHSETANIEIPNFFTQRVAIEAEHFRRLDLIAPRCRKAGGD